MASAKPARQPRADNKPAKPATTSTTTSTATASEPISSSSSKRFPQPDDKKHNEAIAELKQAREALDKRFEESREKIKGFGNINGSYDAKTTELTNLLNTLGAERKRLRDDRSSLQGQLRDSRQARESKTRETDAARRRLPYQTLAEFDQAISLLEKKISTGSLKMLEEKQVVTEISALQRARKQLESILEKQHSEPAASSSADNAALGEKQTTLDATLNSLTVIEKQYEDVRTELNSLRDKKTADFNKYKQLRADTDEIKKQQDELDSKRRELESAHRKAFEEYHKWQAEENARQREVKRQVREQMLIEKKKAAEERRREERSIPKFEAEIASCSALIKYLQQHYPSSEQTDTSKEAEAAEKKPEVEEGVVVLKKKSERDDVFYFSGKKDAGKSKKPAAAAVPKKTDVKIPLGTMEDFWKLKVEVPSTVADVPKAIESLKQTKLAWEKRQKEELEKGLREEQQEKDREATGTNGASHKSNDEEHVEETIDEQKHVDHSDHVEQADTTTEANEEAKEEQHAPAVDEVHADAPAEATDEPTTTEPVVEATAEVVAETTAEPVAEPVAEPAAESTTEPAEEPTAEPTTTTEPKEDGEID